MRSAILKILAARSHRPELTYVIKNCLRLDFGLTRDQMSGVTQTLKRLEKDGLVTSIWPGQGHNAEWRITDAGRAALSQEDRA